MPKLVYLVKILMDEVTKDFYVIEICDTNEWAQQRARHYRHTFFGRRKVEVEKQRLPAKLPLPKFLTN